MKYFVYILQSEQNNSYYIGSTNNLEKRLNQHNSGQSKSTKRYHPWKLIYYEEFKTRSEAYRSEINFKKRKSRKFIEKLVTK